VIELSLEVKILVKMLGSCGF